jgi:hypothetical protein
MNPLLKSLALLCAIFVPLSSCSPPASDANPATHPLVGAWQAEDSTLFVFRSDHSFHGIDFRGREIWGTWVKLSEIRIGFQSLRYDNFYAPQYAIIRPGDPSQMDYINTGNPSFTAAKRTDVKKAEAAIELIAEPKVVLPKRP